MNDKKYLVLILIGLGVVMVTFYLYTGQKAKDAVKENEKLENEVSVLKKEKIENEKKINRLDKNISSPEEEKIRVRASEFIKLLYNSNPKTDDAKRYEELKKYGTENLVREYFSDTRTSPIIYDTQVSNLNIFNEKFSVLNKDYKVFATLNQLVTDTEGKIVSDRDVAMELNMTYENDEWFVSSFRQFDEKEIRKEK